MYVSSSEQLTAWLAELGVPPSSPVRALAIRDVAPGLTVQGPVPELDEQVRELHRRFRTLMPRGSPGYFCAHRRVVLPGNRAM